MDFAVALGIKKRSGGFFEDDRYIITWAVGHLVELAEPAEYHEKWKRWNMESLPILPDAMRYRPIPGSAKQLAVVQAQLLREDVERVVIATDAGREGEVIAGTIIRTVDRILPDLCRFWTSQALTPQVVLDTLKKLRPASEYDRLWRAGQARQIADWLVGMNLSRAATIKLRNGNSAGGKEGTFSVGRVQTAVLALLVDRLRERDDFKPAPYWQLKVSFSNEKGIWKGAWFRGEEDRFLRREEPEALIPLLSGATGTVNSVKREKKKQPPPALYSLTDLQREANVKYGLSAKQTLDIAQGLYEAKKCLSYPRTDSRVMGSQNVDLAKKLVEKLTNRYPDLFRGVEPKRVAGSNKRVFNDAKLTDHHALIPLAPLPDGTGRDESNIYDLVLKRFAAVFHADYEYEATEIVTEAAGETFRTRGARPLVPGWKAVYGLKEQTEANAGMNADDDAAEENLPPLRKGDPARVDDTAVEEKMTLPPPEYTENLLLRDMTNPSRYVSEEELQKIFRGDVGLGTQATRAQIIETILNRGYVAREKKKLTATEKGCILIDSLRRFGRAAAVTRPEETARWEMELERIAMGEGDAEAFMAGVRNFVAEGVQEIKSGAAPPPALVPLGKCPKCGGDVIEGKRGFGCSRWREQDGGCRFVVWKEMNGRRLTPGIVRELLASGTTRPLSFSLEDGQEITASLQLVRNETTGDTSVILLPGVENGENAAPGEPGSSSPGPCPLCGSDVVEGTKGFGCSRWKNQDGGCRFIVWKNIAGREISEAIVAELLMKGETAVLEGFVSKKGKPFAAKLKLEGPDYRATFAFD